MNKKFLLWVTAAYIAGIVLGLLLFRSPSLSPAYLKEHGEEHERYLAVIKSEPFKAYEERPALHPLEGKLAEEVEFAEHYRESEAFLHEEHRVWWYVQYFKVLNSLIFVLYLAGFLGKPLLGFLDNQIQEIRRNLDEAAKARREADAQKAAVQEKVEGWAKLDADIRSESEATIARQVAKIRSEADDAEALLAKQTASRKQAELQVGARAIKTELVSEAIRQIEQRYKTETAHEELTANVDRFVSLLERLS
ncbi:MAG: synthase subunit b [Candidatus Hydrogenedentes bacterium]|nr:synthase subunit b [Candidatus Hydrogenedentota bacterium]